MLSRPVFLILAAMLCGAPATIVAVVMLPWSIAYGIAGVAERPWLATINLLLVLAAVYALGSYWSLAAKTIKGQPFKFGWAFKMACAAALFCVAAVFDTLPTIAALFVVAPIVAATGMCLYKQRSVERHNAA